MSNASAETGCGAMVLIAVALAIFLVGVVVGRVL